MKIFSFCSKNNKKKIFKLLETIKGLVEAGEDYTFGDKEKAIQEIDAAIYSPSKENIEWLIAPTGNIQELSIDNGWSDEFITLSERLENLI